MIASRSSSSVRADRTKPWIFSREWSRAATTTPMPAASSGSLIARRTEQGRQHEGGFRGEARIVGADAPVGNAGKRHHARDDGRQQHIAADRLRGGAGQRDDRKGANARCRAARPGALAPFAVGSDQQADAKGDREAHQARVERPHGAMLGEHAAQSDFF